MTIGEKTVASMKRLAEDLESGRGFGERRIIEFKPLGGQWYMLVVRRGNEVVSQRLMRFE